MNDDTAIPVVVGLIIGLFVGLAVALLVTTHNANYDEAATRKRLVELGVGSYDSQTGAFQIRGCSK